MKKYNYIMLDQAPEILFYLLGAFITDGCVTGNGKRNGICSSWTSSIISQDLDWMELIRNVVCPELSIRNYNNGGNVLWITNKKIGEWLITNGCVPRKSTIVEVPQIPGKYLLDFVRGCWDGDGCLSSYKKKSNNQIVYSSYLCSASKIFLEEIAAFLKTENINCSICEVNKKPCQINNRKVIPQNPHYRLCLGGKATYKLVKLLYHPDHKLSMPRKNNKAQEIIKYYTTLE
jgi:hypothetical protein